MTNNDLTTRINNALTAERAAAKPATPWTDERRILENLSEIANPANALVNPSSHEGYGEACAFPAMELESIQKNLYLGDENPFVGAEGWLADYEAEHTAK